MVSDEGKAAFALISRLIVEMAVNDLLPKDAVLQVLGWAMKDLQKQAAPGSVALLRALAVEIDDHVRDEPDDGHSSP